MGFLNKLFGTRNAAKAARPHLAQIPGYGREGYQSYIDQGRRVDPALEQRYSEMSQDPSGMIDALMGKYKESPFFQRKRDQQLGAARSSAAQGGYAGTPFAQEQQMELADILASGDMQQWLQNVMGTQTQGDAGLQGISTRGFQASGSLADYLGSAAGQRGGMEAGGVMGQNAGQQALINALIQAGAAAAGAAAGVPPGMTGNTGGTPNQAPTTGGNAFGSQYGGSNNYGYRPGGSQFGSGYGQSGYGRGGPPGSYWGGGR